MSEGQASLSTALAFFFLAFGIRLSLSDFLFATISYQVAKKIKHYQLGRVLGGRDRCMSDFEAILVYLYAAVTFTIITVH